MQLEELDVKNTCALVVQGVRRESVLLGKAVHFGRVRLAKLFSVDRLYHPVSEPPWHTARHRRVVLVHVAADFVTRRWPTAPLELVDE